MSKTAETLPEIPIPVRRDTPTVPRFSKGASTLPEMKAPRTPAGARGRTDPTGLVDTPVWSRADDTPPPISRPRTPGGSSYSMVVPRSGPSSQPVLDRYLATLPDGLRSYPEARAKGLTVRTLIDDPIHPVSREMGLPAELAQLARTPPAADAWVPQVWLSALHLITFERVFAGGGGVEDFEEWVYQRNLRMLRASLHKGKVTSPEALFASQAALWPSFYRGSTLTALDAAPGRASFRLGYPPNCWPELSRLALAAALRAAAIVVGAQTVTAKSAEESLRSARFELRWT